MMKVDLFAFGGGFASVPLMYHEVVNMRHWMDGKTFMDGIALGQVTPGPIVITATFVGIKQEELWRHNRHHRHFLSILLHCHCGRFRTSTACSIPSFSGALWRGILVSFVGLLLAVTCISLRLSRGPFHQ